MIPMTHRYILFFFNDTATTEIYTLSLHDALPISCHYRPHRYRGNLPPLRRYPYGRLLCGLSRSVRTDQRPWAPNRSEEHTSELQSQSNLVCRLLLEKKKKL